MESRVMETTAYCSCKKCCEWKRGSWKCLKLNFWMKYTATGEPRRYRGRTASGTRPQPHRPGRFSLDSAAHPWMIPPRILLFPWLLLPSDGTLAADTAYYPFGTRMKIPGYGWGVVEDRGSAITGPRRIDLFFSSHRKALRWGRQDIETRIQR